MTHNSLQAIKFSRTYQVLTGQMLQNKGGESILAASSGPIITNLDQKHAKTEWLYFLAESEGF